MYRATLGVIRPGATWSQVRLHLRARVFGAPGQGRDTVRAQSRLYHAYSVESAYSGAP